MLKSGFVLVETSPFSANNTTNGYTNPMLKASIRPLKINTIATWPSLRRSLNFNLHMKERKADNFTA